MCGRVPKLCRDKDDLRTLKQLLKENYFAAKYYEWADSEDLQLLLPTLDRGWDFKIDRNNKKIQVKRFIVGIDRAKMRLYDCEQSAQDDVVDNGKEDTPSEESKFKDKFGGFKFNQ